jgi:hypothetical protein
MLYFDSTLPQGFMIDPPNSSIDTLAPATREVLHLTEYENIEEAAIYAKRIWFVIYQSSIDEYASSIKTLPPDLEYLNENFRLENIEEWDDVRVYLYSSLPKIK